MFIKTITTTIISFILLAGTSYAQPIIDTDSGAWEDGQTITISGSGFGTKTTASPYLWDNFEAGNNGIVLFGKNPVVGTSAWQECPIEDGDAVYSNIQTKPNSNMSLRAMGDGGAAVDYPIDTNLTGYNSKLFLSFWFYAEDPSFCSQVKYWSLIHYKPITWDTYTSSHWITDKNELIVRYAATNIKEPDYSPDLTPGKWYHFELQFQMSSNVDTEDGYLKVLTSSDDFNDTYNVQMDDSAIKFISLDGEFYNRLWLRTWVQNCSSLPDTYYDDVYFDTSWQRIEIGDAATWDACTHREIQIPKTWSENSITFEVNQGSFLDGKQVYLYVLDENGVVSNSYSITIGDGSYINILSPTTANIYTTNESTITLSGNAADSTGITSITGLNDKGGTGDAINDSGDWTSWSIENIPLVEGENVITVTAIGNEISTDIITVTYTDEPEPETQPGPEDGSDQEEEDESTISVGGCFVLTTGIRY